MGSRRHQGGLTGRATKSHVAAPRAYDGIGLARARTGQDLCRPGPGRGGPGRATQGPGRGKILRQVTCIYRARPCVGARPWAARPGRQGAGICCNASLRGQALGARPCQDSFGSLTLCQPRVWAGLFRDEALSRPGPYIVSGMSSIRGCDNRPL